MQAAVRGNGNLCFLPVKALRLEFSQQKPGGINLLRLTVKVKVPQLGGAVNRIVRDYPFDKPRAG